MSVDIAHVEEDSQEATLEGAMPSNLAPILPKMELMLMIVFL